MVLSSSCGDAGELACAVAIAPRVVVGARASALSWLAHPKGVSDTRATAANVGKSSSKKFEGNHLAPFWAPICGPGRRARRGEGARRVPRRVSSSESVAERTAAEPSLESRSRVAVDAVLAGRHVAPRPRGCPLLGDIRRSV